ncbi:MAG: PAS domain S-box protein [Planctomycetaceae bacterium]|nr:PAS domain S-box protein [Planctomycetaceae bacterium]
MTHPQTTLDTETQQRLRDSEECLRSLIRQSPDGIVIINRQGIILEWNDGEEKTTGIPRAEALGRPLWAVQHELAPPQRKDPIFLQGAIGKIFRGLSEDAALRRVVEDEIVRRDGQRRVLQSVIFGIRGADGLIACGITRDITEIRQSQQRFRVLVEATGEGIVIHDNGRIIDANEQFARMHGYEPSEVIDMEMADFIMPDDLDRVRAYAAGTQDDLIEFRGRRRDGSRVFVEAVCRTAWYDDREVRICVLRDLTQRREVQEALKHAKEELEQRVAERTVQLQRRSEQLARLASELATAEQRERRHLAAVLHDGLQQLLVGAQLRLSVMSRSTRGHARQIADEIGALLSESIETSRSLTAELSPPILQEGGLVRALEWLVRWMRDKHDLTVDLDAAAAPSPEAMSDDVALLLFQATRELLFNVVKHAGVNSAAVKVARSDGAITVAVSDCGGGFDPAEVASRGFDNFGLFSICERLELLGGRMEIDSAPQRGSRFTLRAPVIVAGGKSSTGQHQPVSMTIAAPEPTAQNRRIRLALVDDHAVMRQGLSLLLRQESDMVIVGEAGDGHSALELVRQVLPDVVLMDVSMPGMGGVEATRQIRSLAPATRVIGLSMFEQADQAAAMRAAGACDYLSKSGPSDALLEAIRRCGGGT